MSFNAPYNQKIFMGLFASDADALTFIQAQKWDSLKTGAGVPERGMQYYNTMLEMLCVYNGTAWIALATGILWQDSVLSLANNPPGGPADGDRYLIDVAPVGAWVGHAENIAVWDAPVGAWTYVAPVEGMALWIEDVNLAYRYTGVAWVRLPSSAQHNDLLGIQGGAAADYYHLTLAQHTDLTDGGVATVHVHTLDQSYDATGGGAGATITVDAADLAINQVGAFSSVFDLSGVTGAADGVLIDNGADYVHVLRTAADEIWLDAVVNDLTTLASNDWQAVVSANSAAAKSLSLTADNAGAGIAEIVLTAKTNVTVDALGGAVSLDAGASSNLTVTANAAGDQTLTVLCTNAGAGAGNVALGADDAVDIAGGTAVNVDVPLGTVSLDAGLSSNLTITANAAGDQTLLLSATNAGAGAGLVAITADGLVSLASTGGSMTLDTVDDLSITLTANDAGNKDLTLQASNAGAGTGRIVIACDGSMDLSAYAGPLSINAAEDAIFSVGGNDAIDKRLDIVAENLGAGTASIYLTADDDITLATTTGSVRVDAAIDLVGAATELVTAAVRLNDTIAGAAANQVLDAIDNVDEGASVYKAGFLTWDFFLRGATAGTATEVYGGKIRIKFQGASAASAKITVTWDDVPSPDVTFDTTIAADQIQLRASNSLGTAIYWYAIRNDYITSQSHV